MSETKQVGWKCRECETIVIQKTGWHSCKCGKLSIDVPSHSSYMRVIGAGDRVEIKRSKESSR